MSELYIHGQKVIGAIETGSKAAVTDTYLSCSATWVKKDNLIQVTVSWTAKASLAQDTTYVNALALPYEVRPISAVYLAGAIGNKSYSTYINTSGNFALRPQTTGIAVNYGGSNTFTYICNG